MLVGGVGRVVGGGVGGEGCRSDCGKKDPVMGMTKELKTNRFSTATKKTQSSVSWSVPSNEL